MPDRRIYLDHNASAPMLPEAKAALVAALEIEGNASSVHREGRAARGVVEGARRSLASLIGAVDENIVFTSGASEAAATCLTPDWIEDGRAVRASRLAVAETDHPCLRTGGRFEADAVTRLPVDGEGQIRLDALASWLSATGDERPMLALTLANSETGVLQAIGPLMAQARAAGALVVVDIVQAVGRMAIDIAELGADAVILSGHKFGAAKGIGAFVLARAGLRPQPLLKGGGQELRRRAGTEAVALIASLGAAARIAGARLAADPLQLSALRARLEARLCDLVPGAIILGGGVPRLGNTLAIAVPGVRAETAQIGLDLAGFAVSSGSACSSGKVGPSDVLKAMCDGGLGIDPRDGAIRVSFGYETRQDDLDGFADAFAAIALRGGRGAGTRDAA